MATAAASSPAGKVMVLTTLTWVPLRVATVTELSARLAIRTSVPALLMAMPEGCLPTVTVSTSVGGLTCRSITNSLLSGTGFQVPPSSTHSTELATRATRSSGATARLVGGPSSEFISGKVPTMRGCSRCGAARDAGLLTMRDVHDDHRIRAGGPGHLLPGVSKVDLVVEANDQVLGLAHSGKAGQPEPH